MKKFFIIISVFLGLTACQENLIERRADGVISVSLGNSPAVEVLTKAGEQVAVDNFNVYIINGGSTYRTYIYKDMSQPVLVPAGIYSVSADNISESESVEAWGQVRYAGTTESKEVVAGDDVTEFTLTCKMVNAAVSVVYGENIAAYFDDFKVTVYTDEARKLVYEPTTESVGYFLPGTLYYEFSGKYMNETKPMVIKGSKSLTAATHLHLNFRISEQNGYVGKPEIIVDTTCEDLYETVSVDPTDGGSFITN